MKTENKKMDKNEVVELLRNYPTALKNAKKEAKKSHEFQIYSDMSEKELCEYFIELAAYELITLRDAQESGSEIRLLCVFAPKNLDAGSNWYRIVYADNNKFCFFGPIILMDWNWRKHFYGFSSHALGMSRAMDATDYIFRLLEKIGGEYIQPDIL